MKMLINIEDPVLGSWHQITVEQKSELSPDEMVIRLDGTTLPDDFETYNVVLALQAAFKDEFAGITDGKDVYLADMIARREADVRLRK